MARFESEAFESNEKSRENPHGPAHSRFESCPHRVLRVGGHPRVCIQYGAGAEGERCRPGHDSSAVESIGFVAFGTKRLEYSTQRLPGRRTLSNSASCRATDFTVFGACPTGEGLLLTALRARGAVKRVARARHDAVPVAVDRIPVHGGDARC